MPGIKEEYNRNWKAKESPPPGNIVSGSGDTEQKNNSGIIVEGIDNCLIRLARCCSPLPGEEIIGFINRGTGLTVHRRDCINVPSDIESSPEPDRWVRAYWDSSVQVTARSTIDVYVIDRDGIVLDISTYLANAHVKIYSMNARQINDGNGLITLTISVNSKEHLASIEKGIKKISGVYHIERSMN